MCWRTGSRWISSRAGTQTARCFVRAFDSPRRLRSIRQDRRGLASVSMRRLAQDLLRGRQFDQEASDAAQDSGNLHAAGEPDGSAQNGPGHGVTELDRKNLYGKSRFLFYQRPALQRGLGAPAGGRPALVPVVPGATSPALFHIRSPAGINSSEAPASSWRIAR